MKIKLNQIWWYLKFYFILKAILLITKFEDDKDLLSSISDYEILQIEKILIYKGKLQI